MTFVILQLASWGAAASEPSLQEPLLCSLDERQAPCSERPHSEHRMWRPQVGNLSFVAFVVFCNMILVTESANPTSLNFPLYKGWINITYCACRDIL